MGCKRSEVQILSPRLTIKKLPVFADRDTGSFLFSHAVIHNTSAFGYFAVASSPVYLPRFGRMVESFSFLFGLIPAENWDNKNKKCYTIVI